MRLSRTEADRRRAEYERRYNRPISLAEYMAKEGIELIADSVSSYSSSSSSCSDSYSSSSSSDSSSCSSD